MDETPRVPKTKAEIIAGLKENKDFQRKIMFAREVFYPAIIKANPTVEEAGTWLSGFNSALMQAFLERMKEVKMSELKLGLKLNTMDDRFVEFGNIVSLFDDMTVFEAKDHIEGMRGEVDIWKRDEDHARPFSELQVKWSDEL